MANQLAGFLPDLSQNCKHLKALLQKKNAFVWGEMQERDFVKTKELLTSNLIVKPFDMNLPTFLLTDASRLHGLGYALIQKEANDAKRLIKCGSCSLTPTQQRYATIELEALGIHWALEKCEYFLRGCEKFTVVTDHRPLLGIWNNGLADITNPRLQKIRMKTLRFSFNLEWHQGKTHFIADALSRYPVFAPDAGDDEIDAAHIACCRRVQESTPCSSIIDAVQMDEKYLRIVEAVQDKDFDIDADDAHPAADLRKQWNRISLLQSGDTYLIVIDGIRLFVPESMRPQILQLLHNGHPGIVKMQKKAGELYFWPHMNNEIKVKVEACKECQEIAPTKQKSQITNETALAPMSHVGVDLFQWQGQHFLVIACRFSGYFFVYKLKSTTTDKVLECMRQCFLAYGFPLAIRSDGGPQFRGPFRQFCVDRNIKHELASPYNPASNGLAESAVKQAKHLLKKVGSFGNKYNEHLSALLNTPRQDKVSPSQLMFGRRRKEEFAPVLEQQLQVQHSASEGRDQERQRVNSHKNATRKPCPTLAIGSLVRVQNPHTGVWDSEARIIKAREHGVKSLVLENLKTGEHFTRSVDQLRPFKSVHFGEPCNFTRCLSSREHSDTSSSTSWHGLTATTTGPPTTKATLPERPSWTSCSQVTSVPSSGYSFSSWLQEPYTNGVNNTKRSRTSSSVPSTLRPTTLIVGTSKKAASSAVAWTTPLTGTSSRSQWHDEKKIVSGADSLSCPTPIQRPTMTNSRLPMGSQKQPWPLSGTAEIAKSPGSSLMTVMPGDAVNSWTRRHFTSSSPSWNKFRMRSANLSQSTPCKCHVCSHHRLSASRPALRSLSTMSQTPMDPGTPSSVKACSEPIPDVTAETAWFRVERNKSGRRKFVPCVAP